MRCYNDIILNTYFFNYFYSIMNKIDITHKCYRKRFTNSNVVVIPVDIIDFRL